MAVRPPRNIFWTRVLSFSVWETEARLDHAEIGSAPLEEGSSWSARLEPLRVWQQGHTVIDPAQVTESSYAGPVVSVTISEAIPRHVPAFLRASRLVEQQVLAADDLVWTMGFFKPPMWFSTITIWRSGDAADAFAFSDAKGGAHQKALPNARDWFRRSTTMRFRPYAVIGSVSGEHPLARSTLSTPP